MKGSTSAVNHFQWVSDVIICSDGNQNRTSQVQVIHSIFDAQPSRLDEQCIWMIDCRFVATDEGIIGTLEVPKILERIIIWMSKVTRWNAIIMLPPMRVQLHYKIHLVIFMDMMIWLFMKECIHFLLNHLNHRGF